MRSVVPEFAHWIGLLPLAFLLALRLKSVRSLPVWLAVIAVLGLAYTLWPGWWLPAFGVLLLVSLAVSGSQRDPAYWWLSLAFAVSFVADSLAHSVDAWLLSSVYPVTQAALIGAVLLARKDAWLFLLVLVNAGIVAALFAGPWPDLLLHTVAFGGVTAIVYDRHYLGFVRTALLAYCGLGLAAWYWFALAPSFTHYAIYQATRFVGLAWFCMACLHPAPKLRVT